MKEEKKIKFGHLWKKDTNYSGCSGDRISFICQRCLSIIKANRRLRRPVLYPVELRAPGKCLDCSTRVLSSLVGVERFELPTSCSQSRRATRLRYTPFSAYRLPAVTQRRPAERDDNTCYPGSGQISSHRTA